MFYFDKIKKSMKIFSLLLVISIFNIPISYSQESQYDNPDYSYDVIYQIVTDRFYDGDNTNNPVGEIYDKNDNRKYQGGDWKGIISKIEDGYLTDLGITAIWISSPVENITTIDPSNNSTSYHGYWGRDFFETNKAYGSLEDFKRLIKVSHDNGIKVIIDFAPNHTSTAEYGDLVFPEDGKLLRNGELLGSYSDDFNNIFNKEGWTNFKTYENGIYHSLYGLADLNHSNEIVDNYMKDAIKYWLDLGIDGIRVDAVKHMSKEWQKNWLSSIYENKNVFVFGEWFAGSDSNDPLMSDFANTSGMSLLDFRFSNSLRQLLTDNNYDMSDFYRMLVNTENDYEEVNDQVTFVDNHDMSRIYSITNDKEKVDLAHAILLTSRGVPTIYYGSENYLKGLSDPDNRAKIQEFNRDSKSYKIISKIANLRKKSPSLAMGSTKERWINKDVLILERIFGGETTLIAVNIGDKSYDIDHLYTSLSSGYYEDYLENIQNGTSIKVDSGKVSDFNIKPNSFSIWVDDSRIGTGEVGDLDPGIGLINNKVSLSGENLDTFIKNIKIDDIECKIINKKSKFLEFIIPEISPGNKIVKIEMLNGDIIERKFEVLTNKQIPHRFIINNAYTYPGESVYVVGNVHELGNWDTNNAVGPFFNDTESIAKYPNWFYDVSLPIDTNVEYKFIKKNTKGEIIWESGSNRSIVTSNSANETIVNWK